MPGEFVGLDNFRRLATDPIFHQVVWNTVWYTVVTTVFKLGARALARDAAEPALQVQGVHPRLHPAAVHHPDGAVDLRLEVDVRPDLQRAELDALPDLGVIRRPINWLGDGDLAMLSIIIVNIWRGVPFFAISLLAGLQTISPDLNEAAAIDGARPWQRFWHITWPLLLPVTMVVVLFSVIQTFADFQIVYVMTGGGPGQRHAPVRDLRLPARRRHRAAEPGRRGVARDVPDPVR